MISTNLLNLLRSVNNFPFSIKYHNNLVASYCYDNQKIYIWDIFTGHPVNIFISGDPIYSFSFSPDGKKLLSGDTTGVIKQWDISNGILLNEIPAHDFCVYCLEYSPNSGFFVSGGMDKKTCVWDSYCNLLQSYDCHFEVCYLRISPDSQYFCVTGWNNNLLVWNIHSQKCIHIVNNDGQFLKTAFSPSGKYIATKHFDNIKIWNIQLFPEFIREPIKMIECQGIGDIFWTTYKVESNISKAIKDNLSFLPNDIIEFIIFILNNHHQLIYNNQILFEDK